MEWRMRSVINNVSEVLSANYPDIRLFHVARKASGHPQKDVEALWQECEPGSVIDFSAVAYFFGRMLHKELDVPVGLIHTSWGGTRIEPWTPPAGFKAVPELDSLVTEIESAEEQYQEELGLSLNEIEMWLTAARQAYTEKAQIPEMPQLAQFPLAHPRKPTALYNGQVHGLVPFAIRGAIWYQGESNRYDGLIYFEKMQALIAGWRKVWGIGDFPFYYVQLAPYSYGMRDELEQNRLPIIREAQRKALGIPNTGMAVTTDIGNLYDIHPRNKQEVGRRLALWALAKTYNNDSIVYSGPLYRSMQMLGNKIRIQFDHSESGLKTRDGNPLDWFEIAGPDTIFVRAQAMIRGNEVEVWSAEVGTPVAVRFGWHEEAGPNLVNGAGLPASPFNTMTK
jgi:sialate O-acetylesterase